MFMKNFTLIFIFFLLSGSIISLSASSWIISWVGFEINMMSMAPLLLFNLNFKSTEATLKYFIVQVVASSILLLSFLKESQMMNLFLNFFSFLIMSSLCLKMGSAPLHMWLPQVVKNTKWNLIFLIFTWQKVAPLCLLTPHSISPLLLIFIFSSAFFGCIGGLFHTSLKLIFSFSSISHLGWTLILLSFFFMAPLFYFMIYSFMIFYTCWFLNFFKINSLKKISSNELGTLEKLIFGLNVLSMGGMPPLVGFFMKAFSIMFILKTLSTLPLLALIFSSMISLIFYLSMFFPSTTPINFTKNMTKYETTKKKINPMSIIVLIMNMITPTFILMVC